jgi:hypothetical protein
MTYTLNQFPSTVLFGTGDDPGGGWGGGKRPRPKKKPKKKTAPKK